MDDLMERINKYIELEELLMERDALTSSSIVPKVIHVSGNQKKTVDTIKAGAKKPLKASDFVAEWTIFTEPIYMLLRKIENEGFFRWPDHKMGTQEKTKDKNVYCTYHQEQGHYTTACKPFKAYLQSRVSAGNLDSYIDKDKTLTRAQNAGAAAAGGC